MIGMTMSFRCPHAFHRSDLLPLARIWSRYLVTESVTWVSEGGLWVTSDSGDFPSKQAFICLFQVLNVLAKRSERVS